MGTPIRLVRNDGGIIELMATTLTMNVDRGVSPLAMPFAGGNRFAFDLNLPKSLITIEGVMTDDDILNMNSIAQDAVGSIDFAKVQDPGFDVQTWVSSANIDSIIAPVPSADDAGVAHAKTFIEINTVKIYLTQHSSDRGQAGGRYYISVFTGSAYRTADEIAESLHQLIATNKNTWDFQSIRNGSVVTMTTINLNSNGNDIMNMNDGFVDLTIRPYQPKHVQFAGGRDSSQVTNKSAGDKVAELFAVLNNSNNGGMGAMVGTAAVAGGAIGAGIATGGIGLLLAGAGVGVAGGINQANYDTKYGDYITAIQIPFSSNVNNRESIFYMPTGSFKQTTDKTVDNALATGTEFDSSERHYTGIKGTVANATFVQLGGEPIYSFTINFAPIDWIF